MKKFLALLVIIGTLIALASCNEYKPVKSTEEEEKVVMTMSFGDEKYEIKYELYRALFLNHKSEIDGGDASVWSGSEKATYIDKINKEIIYDAAKIFAAIYVCHVGVNFDVYSKEADRLVEEYIAEAVSVTAGGTYDEYLTHLKSLNLNYSVQDLMFRYYIALDKISEYYAGKDDESTTEEDETVDPYYKAPLDKVREFYYSDDFMRVMYASMLFQGPPNPDNYPPEKHDEYLEDYESYINYIEYDMPAKMDNIRTTMEEAKDQDIFAMEMAIALSATSPNDISTGIFVPKNTFNNDLHDSIQAYVFALEEKGISDVIKIDSSGEADINGLYIFYNMGKSEADFEKYYNQIRNSYIENLMGEMLNAHADALAKSVKTESDYSSVNHTRISM